MAQPAPDKDAKEDQPDQPELGRDLQDHIVWMAARPFRSLMEEVGEAGEAVADDRRVEEELNRGRPVEPPAGAGDSPIPLGLVGKLDEAVDAWSSRCR